MNPRNQAKTIPIETLSKTIAGEITMSEKPSAAMKKWREILGIRQKELASALKITPSVISDYESGRRTPGIKFVKKYITTLLNHEAAEKTGIIEKHHKKPRNTAIIDIREFLQPIKSTEFIEHINGRTLAGPEKTQNLIYGYTLIDSIKAILEMSDKDFTQIFGLNNQRALIFTKVNLGRSPMIAVKVSTPKPAMVVLHGLTPEKVDRLALKIAERERIPLIVSLIKEEEELAKQLQEIHA